MAKSINVAGTLVGIAGIAIIANPVLREVTPKLLSGDLKGAANALPTAAAQAVEPKRLMAAAAPALTYGLIKGGMKLFGVKSPGFTAGKRRITAF